MTQIENDPIIAEEIARQIKSSANEFNSPSTLSLGTSNGPAAQDINRIFTQTQSMFSSFTNAINNSSDNIVKMSQKFEEMDNNSGRKNDAQ